MLLTNTMPLFAVRVPVGARTTVPAVALGTIRPKLRSSTFMNDNGRIIIASVDPGDTAGAAIAGIAAKQAQAHSPYIALVNFFIKSPRFINTQYRD